MGIEIGRAFRRKSPLRTVEATGAPPRRPGCCRSLGVGSAILLPQQPQRDARLQLQVTRGCAGKKLRSLRMLPGHLQLTLGQQAFLMVLIVAPQHQTDDQHHSEQGPTGRPGDAMYTGAKQIAAQSERRRPDNSAGSVENEKPGRR